jgi:hypothetical protein
LTLRSVVTACDRCSVDSETLPALVPAAPALPVVVVVVPAAPPCVPAAPPVAPAGGRTDGLPVPAPEPLVPLVPPEVPPALPDAPPVLPEVVVEVPPVDPDAPLLASAIAARDRDKAAAATVVKKVIRMLNSIDAEGPKEPNASPNQRKIPDDCSEGPAARFGHKARAPGWDSRKHLDDLRRRRTAYLVPGKANPAG